MRGQSGVFATVDMAIAEKLLTLGADIAEIVTGLIAAIVGGRYLWLVRQRRLILETYLEVQRADDQASGKQGGGVRSVLHLMGYAAMTEPEVLDAAFASRHIRSFTHNDPATGRSDALLFQFQKNGGQYQARRACKPAKIAP